MSSNVILREAMEFLKELEALREEVAARDAYFKKVKNSTDKEELARYQKFADDVSQKCINYGRGLCDNPTPLWVNRASREHVKLANSMYEVVRDKLCASLSVFDNAILPNARTLVDLASMESE
ncbi:MAG: hypothetical protein QG557_225 [Pseudomonadota bacterium]|jgi:hypothetical protein|nr:hypothetical protein [Pseudomonadota bacterium]